MDRDEGLTLLVFWMKWHRVIQNSLSANTLKLDLWILSLIYHVKEGIYRKAEAFEELLLARWFDPNNATAHAYLELFCVYQQHPPD
ncbi:hypothetical protein V2H45_02605 [Tumidithrix elongata RA019]|uniref:Uncharacterized protein n=2 Tax=Tumidithrix TaxID=3088355 RepID=A0AAW9PTH8_9CYAN|nr:hypothetical protein [Tumidithrix elongata RA019]